MTQRGNQQIVKFILQQFEERSSSALVGNVSNAVNTVAAHPLHPDLICGASRLDKKLVFWDYRRP
jgi:THO complex subunit 3